MKKDSRKMKKLTLNRETLRGLTDLDLRPAAAGEGPIVTGPSRCDRCTGTCTATE